MSTGSRKPKSKEVTWSEKDLAQHMLKDRKKPSNDRHGSPKSSPKIGGSSRHSGKSNVLSSTTPVSSGGRASSGRGGKERLSSTATAASPLSRREAKESSRERGGVADRRDTSQREREKAKAGGSVSTSKTKEKKRDGVTRRDSDGTQARGGGGRGGREETRNTKSNTRQGHVRDSNRVSESKRHGREGAGRREKSEDPRQGRQEESKLGATSTSSMREREPGAPLADAIEDMERELKEKTKLKKSATSERQYPDGATPQPMEEVRDEVEEIEYEEEFEDEYNGDDFEEDIQEETESESESTGNDVMTNTSPMTMNPDPSPRINLVEIMQAIDAENKQLGGGGGGGEGGGGGGGEGEGKFNELPPSPQPEHSPLGVEHTTSQGSVRSLGSMKRRFVDFSSAKNNAEKERVAQITRKRGQELLSMIELDVVAIDLLDLQPLSEYELYMHSFGAEGTRQVSCQTGEDSAEVEVQTEDVEVAEKWVQWPPEDLRGFGGPVEETEEAAVSMVTSVSDTVRLTSFLKRASQVMAVLLEENAVPSGQSPLRSHQSQIPFCTSHTQIQPPSQLVGCPLTSVEYSPTHPHLLMTTHRPTTDVCLDSVPHRGGVVCVWSTRELSQPQYLLLCESTPVCGCFSNHRITLVFSGNEDGSVVVWDLREPVAMHTRPPGATHTSQGLIPRFPTFNTAALPHKYNHHSPIITMTPLTSSTLHPSPLTTTTATDHEAIGLSFQLATLDSSGLVTIWVAVETKPHPQGSESDLGLVPGGRIKIVWSTSLDTVRSLCLGSIPVQTLCVQFHPMDTNQIFIGTDEGTIVHQSRYGRRPIPSQYQCQTKSHCPCDITSLSFSPWQPDYFLSGQSNGYLALYHTKRPQPLVTWSESTNGIAVRQVEWAWHQPGMFLVLDTSSNLYMWSLLESDRGPTQVHTRREKAPDILSFRWSPSPSPSPSPSLTLCLSDSTLEIHQLQTSLQTTPYTEHSQQFLHYLQSLD